MHLHIAVEAVVLDDLSGALWMHRDDARFAQVEYVAGVLQLVLGRDGNDVVALARDEGRELNTLPVQPKRYKKRCGEGSCGGDGVRGARHAGDDDKSIEGHAGPGTLRLAAQCAAEI